ncbi:hypothetical protein FB192DRAFT_1015495 [Mucor lusitanicus]|uniref:Uncharacterized protein n=1 Tax=Mucor circinelloides f. lusitanicus TaxID=29924 RepID=A0A8H4BRX0_MUCCL|nr:hypothetical protein FB192DRAFT_1015495 [Mucor lusitanicus]
MLCMTIVRFHMMLVVLPHGVIGSLAMICCRWTLPRAFLSKSMPAIHFDRHIRIAMYFWTKLQFLQKTFSQDGLSVNHNVLAYNQDEKS